MGVSDAAKIFTSNYSTCMINSSGALKCWGGNGYGQLGVGGTYGYAMSPKTVYANGVTSLSNSLGYHTCGIYSSAFYCWGYNYYGQLGLGSTTNTNTPQAVTF